MESVSSKCVRIEMRGIRACLSEFAAMLVLKMLVGPWQVAHFGLSSTFPMTEFYLLLRLCDQVARSLGVVAPYLHFLNLAEMLNSTPPPDYSKNISAMGSAATGFTQDTAQALGLLSVLLSDISTAMYQKRMKNEICACMAQGVSNPHRVYSSSAGNAVNRRISSIWPTFRWFWMIYYDDGDADSSGWLYLVLL